MAEAPKTMQAAVWTEPNHVEMRTVDVPEVPPGWVLVRVELTGLCGTDFSILHGTHPRARPPLIMGHEITGRVELSWSDELAIGTRVVVEPLIKCGHCWPCFHGAPHVCRNLNLYGIDAPGSLAEFVALPASAVIPVDPATPPHEVALAEPLAVAVHAVNISQLNGPARVVVFGAGPIGFLTALVARHRGAKRILLSEPSAERTEVARSLGFEVVEPGADPLEAISEFTSGNGADIVFDSAAHPSVAAQLSRAARITGTIVLVGVYKAPAAVDLQAITFAEQSLRGVRVYTRGDLEEAVRLIEQDALGLARIPVRVIELADTAAAFDEAMSAGGTLKVLVSSEEKP